MAHNQENDNSERDQEARMPIEEWSDEAFGEALRKVYNKSWEDRSEEDYRIIWEDHSRKRKSTRKKLDLLSSKEGFSLEEWVKFLAETAVDIYWVEKDIQFQCLLLAKGLVNANENICSIPPPYPPAAPPAVQCQYDGYLMSRIAEKLGVSGLGF